jgi:hypothetical protein
VKLFAAGWSACFEGAPAAVARQKKLPLPAGLAIDAEVDLNTAGSTDYFLRARLDVSLPGVERSVPSSWSIQRIRFVLMPRQPVATSTSRSPWSNVEVRSNVEVTVSEVVLIETDLKPRPVG